MTPDPTNTLTPLSAPPALPRPQRRPVSVLKFLFAVAILPVLVLAGSAAFFWHALSQPAYGPAEASEGEFTVAPDVRVEIAPSHRSLQQARFQDFVVTPEGAVIVQTPRGIFDMTGGRRLGYDNAEQVTSMTFIAGALVVTTSERQLGYWDDQGLAPLEVPGISPVAVFGDSSADHLYIVDEHRSDAAVYRLCSLTKGQALQVECGSPQLITAMTRDEVSTIFTAGGGLFRLLAPGQPAMLLKLPNAQKIVGIASSGGTLYFATSSNVYALGQDTAMPVVLGLGGKLQATPGGLFVLDRERGRVFRIAIGKGN